MWFGEPHPFPERGSPTRLSASGQQSYEGWSCRLLPPYTARLNSVAGVVSRREFCVLNDIQWRMLQWTMLQRMVFINKIRMPQRIQMLQRTRRNTIGTRVLMTCRAFPIWLERQSSSLLSFVRFSNQFSSVVCLIVQCIKVKYINFLLFLKLHVWFYILFFLFKRLCCMVTLL